MFAWGTLSERALLPAESSVNVPEKRLDVNKLQAGIIQPQPNGLFQLTQTRSFEETGHFWEERDLGLCYIRTASLN